MIRALYTAASGMNAQQANIDNVAHNLANVNTTGFKKSRMEFEDLVYQELKSAGAQTASGGELPVGLEAGLGTRPVATARDFSTGNLRATSGPLDLAIEGQGFFQVSLPSGETGYTRAGEFHLSPEGGIVTADGYTVEPQLTIPPGTVTITISRDGVVSAAVAGQSAPQQIGTLELAIFQNPAGMRGLGGNLFAATSASGEPTTGVPGTEGLGTIVQ
jgi:flagellar basal-body rod protein FlgG